MGMTSKKSIIFFWALFLVPTLIMAGAAFKLLIHEQERINQSALNALTQRAETIAETIHLTIESVSDNLVQSLKRIDSQQLKPRLLEWEQQNPLVRNVFIFKEGKILTYPVEGMESTLEERQFIARYKTLFSGQMPFETDEKDVEGGPSESGASYGVAVKKRVASSRKQLESLSRVVQSKVAQQAPASKKVKRLSTSSDSQPLDVQEVASESSEPGQPNGPNKLGDLRQPNDLVFVSGQGVTQLSASGWLPWFSENSLYILIWVRPSPMHPVYGLELELMALLSRLVVDFPVIDDTAAALVLTDGSGNHIHQSGGLTLTDKIKSVEQVFVSDLLPHWQINVFVEQKGKGFTNAFLYLSLILTAIFIVAIISGGILMTRMTLKNIKDAQQKTSFVSSVSHELKTPLTSIRMYAELLLAGRVKDTAKKETYLSVIVGESERLTRLINNVLDFGKLEQGKKTYQMSLVDVDAFLYQLIEAHKIRIKQQGLEIIVHVTEDDFSITTDRDALEQVMLNLLDNALKYAGSGKFIKFILQKEAGAILFKMCDDGPGIPISQERMIFEKFHRIDNSLTATQPGSGLGLSIARGILKDLGGDLYIEHNPENGSCFVGKIENQDKGQDKNS